MKTFDIYLTQYGVTVTVGVHSPNAVITPYDISIESVSKHGKEVKCTWWESVNENVLYDTLTKEVNDLMYNLRGN